MAEERSQTILYSTTLHRWECWSKSRVIGHAKSADRLVEIFPNAIPPSEQQYRLERNDIRGA